MKQPISWHEECARNHAISLAGDREYLERLKLRVEQSEKELSFYLDQIAYAKARFLDAFDRDRLMKPRGKK